MGAGQPPAAPLSGRVVAGIAALIVIVAGALSVFLFGGRQASGDIVTFEAPLDAGPRPFTSPVDVSAARVGARIPAFGEGGRARGAPGTRTPFGGSGSNTVCDREKLISYLRDHPDRLRAWAGVLGIDPDGYETYIRGLRPATLSRDARFTNHSFANGRAIARQSILPAGTAVLMDADGKVVVRCRCGNPLLPPRPVPSGTCRGCPRNYALPALRAPTVVIVINPPGGGVVAGRYTVSVDSVTGTGCEAGAAGDIVVEEAGSGVTVHGADLTGSGTVTPDGSFSITVTGGGGKSGVLSGRLAGGRIMDGTLTAFGCIVRFTGTKS
jgi:hypothetical protein